MNTVGGQNPGLSSGEFYDEEGPPGSPLLQAIHPNPGPSRTPPPNVPVSTVSSPSSSDQSDSNNTRRKTGGQGDAVLVMLMGGGRAVVPEVPGGDWDEQRSSPAPDSVGSPSTVSDFPPGPGSVTSDSIPADPGATEMVIDPQPKVPGSPSGGNKMPAEPQPVAGGGAALASLAATALDFLRIREPGTEEPQQGQATASERVVGKIPASIDVQATRERGQALEPRQIVSTPRESSIRDDRSSVTFGAPSPYSPSTLAYSPRQQGLSPMQYVDMRSPGVPGVPGALPPMQSMASPRSENPLPSIREQLGNEMRLEQPQGPSYPHSPPAAIPRLAAMNHTSPPISPNDPYRRDLPSPAHLLGAVSSPHYPQYGYPMAGHPRPDYNSSSTETPSTDPASTPATQISMADHRMSIDGLTNQVGVYVCKVPGCNAPPFQTQYLLNSHANVHSSARPHYCPVKGCSRAEGGKGFKRKNEMIRHGLVHDSPGYVCPFCPDREHRYPRPDNLQRSVLS
jgi:hypothetical protein